jgi:hypothetical protein
MFVPRTIKFREKVMVHTPRIQGSIANFGDSHRKNGWRPTEDSWHFKMFDWYRDKFPYRMGYYAVNNRCDYGKVVVRALVARYHLKTIAKVLLIALIMSALAGLLVLAVMASPLLAIATVLAFVASVSLMYFFTVWLPQQAQFWDWFLGEPIFKTKRLHWLEPWLAVIIAVLAGLVIGAISGNHIAALILAGLVLAAMVIAAMVGLFYVGDVIANKTSSVRSTKDEVSSAKEAESVQMIKSWIVATAYSQQAPDGQDLQAWEANQLQALEEAGYYKRAALCDFQLDQLIDMFGDELEAATGIGQDTLRRAAQQHEYNLLAKLAQNDSKPAMRYERKLARSRTRTKFRQNIREMASIIFGVLGESLGTSKKLVCPLAEIPGEKERVGEI